LQAPPARAVLGGARARDLGARAEGALHALDAVDEGAAQQLGLVRLDVGNLSQELAEDRAQLRARERGAQAVVRAPPAEAEMAIGVARHVEAPGVRERLLVPVGRVVEEHDLLAWR